MIGFSQDELVNYAQFMTAPILIVKTKDGGYFENKQHFYDVMEVLKKTSIDYRFHYVEGTHHMHLNNPEDVTGLINDFIKSHNTGNRSIGGITDTIIVQNIKQQIN